MKVFENDILVIPEEYKKMSVSELEQEENRLLKEIYSSPRTKKVLKKNKNDIVFKV